MDADTNQDLTKKLRTFPENVAREEYEMLFLKALLESPWGKYLIFKGGTALRLAYRSVRFSEDLDFSIRRAVKWPELKQVLETTAADLPAVRIKDLRGERYTYFSLFSIKEDFLPQPFLIKIEISKRPVKWMENRDFEEVTLVDLDKKRFNQYSKRFPNRVRKGIRQIKKRWGQVFVGVK